MNAPAAPVRGAAAVRAPARPLPPKLWRDLAAFASEHAAERVALWAVHLAVPGKHGDDTTLFRLEGAATALAEYSEKTRATHDELCDAMDQVSGAPARERDLAHVPRMIAELAETLHASARLQARLWRFAVRLRRAAR